MLKAIRYVCAITTLLSAVIFTICIMAQNTLPDEIYVSNGDCPDRFSKYNLSVVMKNDKAVAVDSSGASDAKGEAELKLLGIIPVKTAKVVNITTNKVVLCGTPFGIKLFTNGVVIVGMTEVDSENGPFNPSKEAGLREGDRIISINDIQVTSNNQVASLIENLGGQIVHMEVERGGEEMSVEFEPVYSVSSKKYKAGLWVRDSSAGIGTLTFYDPETRAFGGLGHGICDIDTGELLPLGSGEIIPAEITSILKSVSGSPGELCGYFKETSVLGELSLNNEAGVYGQLKKYPVESDKTYEVAMKQDIEEGEAQILSTVNSGEPKTYTIEIERIYYKSESKQKNMVIRVTDPELLEKTGGIVQGMSGSPIIQNGKFVGAVTHVFVNDPERGYAIFAENMVSETESLSAVTYKMAS